MPTIFDVAKRAGVSIATVSRVLSQPDVVTPATRRKVLAAVERLGYAPNASAKNLRVRATRRLIVTVPDISRAVYALILVGIEDEANRQGYSVLLGDTQHDRGKEERYASMLKERQADGFIFIGFKLSDGVANIVRGYRHELAPVVNVMGFRPQLGIPSVQIDNAAAASDAMEHLYRMGHRRVGVVTGLASGRDPSLPVSSPGYVSSERLRGALGRARKVRAVRDLRIVHGDYTVESGVVCGDRLLAEREPPTAVFCFNDEMAMGVLHTTRRRNVRVPDNLSIIGIDDIHHARFWDPPLTTVSMPMREMGEHAVRLVLGMLQNGTRPAERVILPHTLIVRASTAPPGRW